MKWAAAIWHSNPDKQNSLDSLGEKPHQLHCQLYLPCTVLNHPKAETCAVNIWGNASAVKDVPQLLGWTGAEHAEVHPWAEQGCRNAEGQSLQHTNATKSDWVQQSTFCKLVLVFKKKKKKKKERKGKENKKEPAGKEEFPKFLQH